jgi:glycine cleavage system H lipoate-binding protein/ABC-type phosphate transport system substrate-binding protein
MYIKYTVIRNIQKLSIIELYLNITVEIFNTRRMSYCYVFTVYVSENECYKPFGIILDRHLADIIKLFVRERGLKFKISKMKKAVYLIVCMLVMAGSSCITGFSAGTINGSNRDSVKVFASGVLYNLAKSWADKYNSLHTGQSVTVVSVSDRGRIITKMKDGEAGFLTGNEISGLNPEGWNVLVGKDVIVPVISTGNPLLKDIKEKGVTTASLAGFLGSKDSRSWNVLLKGSGERKAGLLIAGNAKVMESIAEFFKIGNDNLSGYGMKTDRELVESLKADPLAIGFCRLAGLIDPSTQELVSGISLLPIDRNGNGIIDYSEKIYDNANDFMRGVWIGKYPRALVSNIYAVSSSTAPGQGDAAFVKWILADGQKNLSDNGFSELMASERSAGIDGLNNAENKPAVYAGGGYLNKTLILVLVILTLAGLVVTLLALFRKRKKTISDMTGNEAPQILKQGSLTIPGGIYFDKTHTWAFLEENGIIRVGIDDFLQHVTGKITRIKMKEEGIYVKKGEKILSIIQNGKQLNLYAPVSGTIVGHNAILETDSSSLNTSPYKNGWIYRIEPVNWGRESQLLFMAEKQREFIKKEFVRLKDFLMNALKGDPAYSQLILQDGGEIADGVLTGMGPEVWEDFQTSFIDPSRTVWFYEIF